jgi:cytochrome bd-type quinol oxidase subunit 1
MIASVVTASFVVAGLGAFYLLARKKAEYNERRAFHEYSS